MAESHECEKCGRSFDSERGLNIHKGRSHDSDSTEGSEDSEEVENKSTERDIDREVRETTSREPTPTSTVNYNPDSVLRFSLSAGQAALIFFLIGVFVGGFFMSAVSGLGSASAVAENPSNNNNGNNPSDAGNQPSKGDTVDTSQISFDGEPMLGDKDAPVTMVLYEDFQCPFCKKFETEAFPQINENYVKNGKVRVVWKDLPLPQLGHDWAEPAAAAMECVYRQDNDVFWTLKDRLFSSAQTLSRGSDKYTPDNIQQEIISMASEEGISSSAVQSCIQNDNPMEEVKSDRQEAGKVGARGTPTILINDQKVVGAQPYSAFKQVIDSELNS